MSSELEVVACCATFSDAAREARHLASRIGQMAFVQRSGHTWQVLAHADHLPLDLSRDEDDANELTDDQYSEQEWEKYVQHEVLDPLREELSDYEDGYARSNDDGWYYED